MNDRLKALKENLQTLREKAKLEYQAALKEAAKEIFEKYPKLESFSWTQYAPYFNDGDECVFRVNEVYQVNGLNEWEDREEIKELGIDEALTEANDLVEAIDDDAMRDLFGNHVEVTCNRDGSFSTSECDHD